MGCHHVHFAMLELMLQGRVSLHIQTALHALEIPSQNPVQLSAHLALQCVIVANMYKHIVFLHKMQYAKIAHHAHMENIFTPRALTMTQCAMTI